MYGWRLARAAGVNMSEWMRGRLLGRDGGSRGEDTAAMLAEVLALRMVLINLIFSLGKGEPMDAEQMQALIERADGSKARRAMERLTALGPQTMPGGGAEIAVKEGAEYE